MEFNMNTLQAMAEQAGYKLVKKTRADIKFINPKTIRARMDRLGVTPKDLVEKHLWLPEWLAYALNGRTVIEMEQLWRTLDQIEKKNS